MLHFSLSNFRILDVQRTLLSIEYENSDNDKTKYDELVNFSLDKKYLKKIIEELYLKDTSKTSDIDNICVDDDDDLISEEDPKNNY
ncbi:14233_t:CDS:2 [Funneliformis mosseae]|uniref:14233_t:CDS:1 n=1 Tax=Funneliformis mosseae TaxID=27381 RepID=A0A9N9G799_FUNMO|nr:14233_t:CDS:2 [Funneliformis mosseae]